MADNQEAYWAFGTKPKSSCENAMNVWDAIQHRRRNSQNKKLKKLVDRGLSLLGLTAGLCEIERGTGQPSSQGDKPRRTLASFVVSIGCTVIVRLLFTSNNGQEFLIRQAARRPTFSAIHLSINS
jgi:hypothetical protein